ncbi:hypothetical protein J7I98_24740 [Streptomyces sp. ISL-98]|uniref:hypothetical protein n=1 Tax=Streptomyces sp. ISL-98 TaxID=2819192 RepID=UPI001BE83A37|nr:hypothetical protein [Streptomyces sp. ISL-98]MBT2509038.1 hypothetical protein [Streptomyces sp. ISL-98]
MTHTISDPEKFFAGVRESSGKIPAGLTSHHVLPSVDGTRCHCLWEAASIDDVRNFVDPPTVGISVNEYFEINAAEAIGLKQ